MTELERATAALTARIAEHDRFNREASERRGSIPPPSTIVPLTPQRIDEMGRAMLRAVNLFSAFSSEPISPLEMLAFVAAAKRGAR